MIEFSKKNARLWSIMGVNPSIWGVGYEEIASKKDSVVITADLARFSGLERVIRKYPERTFNVGIAEQNMMGIAAGMAMEGTQTFVTTYAPFVTYRCADQFRHLMGNMNLNIKAIGSSAGITSGWSGSALQAISDIAFARSIPNIIVLNPADCFEAVKMMIAMSENCLPTYMRVCGSTNIPIVYKDDYDFQIGKAVTLKEGNDICIIASGIGIVSEAIKVAEMIVEKLGIEPSVINLHTIKPLDEERIIKATEHHKLIVTIEEHNVLGGVGSAVAECICKNSSRTKLYSIGINDYICKMGSREFMMEENGLVATKIADGIISKFMEQKDMD